MAADVAKDRTQMEPDLASVAAEIDRAARPFRQPRGNINALRETLLERMWDDAGIIRTHDRLNRASTMLDDLAAELARTGVPDTDRAFNLTWADWLNLDSQIVVSKVITAAALKRENSRGAHYRDDFPKAGDLASSRYTRVRLDSERVDVSDAPVQFTLVKPGETLLVDKAAAE
jgi:fumarate reductase flavoprotein subunit